MQAEAYLRANLGLPVRVRELSRLVGVSERGLRNAFCSVHGTSPAKWMRAFRLHGVRRALSATARPTTVTGIATNYGFYELGRFSVSYREMFGEAPSTTLRDAIRAETNTHSEGRP